MEAALRTAGAAATTTTFSGSLMASRTLSISSRSWSAPVGQTATHWPQATQGASFRSDSKAHAMCVLKPRCAGAMTATCCTLLHTATQRRQRMHFSLSRTR